MNIPKEPDPKGDIDQGEESTGLFIWDCNVSAVELVELLGVGSIPNIAPGNVKVELGAEVFQ